MDIVKITTFAALAIVLILILYLFAPRDKGIYLDSIIRSTKQEALTQSFSISGYENSTVMERNYYINTDGNNTMVKAIYPFYTKILYMINGNDYVCLSYKGNYACDRQTSNDLKSIIVTKEQADKIEKEIKFLWANKALTIKNVEDTSECTKVEYVIDYSHLTPSELAEIGMSPLDSRVYIGSFRHIICYAHDYKPVYRELYYSLNGKKYTYKRSYNFADGSAVAAPIVDAQRYEEVKVSINNVLYLLDKCLLSTSPMQCIEAVAYNEDNEHICDLLENSENCKFRIFIERNDSSLCEQLNSTKDDCYGQYAVQQGDPLLCEKISSAEKREQCISYIKGSCYSDDDCIVGGCSGELCGLKGEELISTCIYKQEYECLRYASCSCINNSCKWKYTNEYAECIAKFIS